MKILLSLEHTIVSDILNILRRLPFQPHFLMEFETQLENMVSAEEKPQAPAEPAPVAADPVVDPVVDPQAPAV